MSATLKKYEPYQNLLTLTSKPEKLILAIWNELGEFEKQDLRNNILPRGNKDEVGLIRIIIDFQLSEILMDYAIKNL